jgi:hypothetical protein
MITVAATVIIGAIAGPDLIKRMPTFEGARAILPKWIRLEERLTPQQMVEQINAFCHDLNTLADARRIGTTKVLNYCGTYNFFMASALSSSSEELRKYYEDARRAYRVLKTSAGLDPNLPAR